jgi:carbon monoxide dehydrogenase subunit G
VKIEESTYVERPPEAVYAFVRDLERAPEWQESLVSVDVDAGTEVRSFAGRRAEARFFVVEDDAPRRLAIRSEGGPAEARAEFDVDPENDGSRVTLTLEVNLKGAARFAGGMVKGAVERETRANLQRLKELLEA